MLTHVNVNRGAWAVTGLLALVAAAAGLWDPAIYDRIVSPGIIRGAYSQDLISAAAALCLLYLALTGRSGTPRRQIIVLGLLGYLFYAYGIYVIERTYNGLYLLYMAVFALSFWALVYAGATLRRNLQQPALPRGIRVVSASGALLQPMVFYPLWIGMLLPLMRTGEQIDSLHSIFILDLCFIMPAFLILSVLTYRQHATGLILLPALHVLGFTLIFSLAAGEVVKPLFDLPLNHASFWPALALSAFFLVLGVLHLRKLQMTPEAFGDGQSGQNDAEPVHVEPGG
ncbi:hypothetical protein [Arthrobacter sp. Br18]|uniref:hypothetical protein n=1 Tax=Arthrobacter sp. Br18 TaxID=1312954 RepID=UPI0004B08636|nr:hypothetical protein [Arthrobacter sp. Br18]